MVKLKLGKLFLDRPAIMKRIDKAERSYLARAGGMIRTTAKRSIRPRKAVSAPGGPPSSHTGKLRDLIFFFYDKPKRSVVIGPEPFKSSNAPELLEHGGNATVPKMVKRIVNGKPRWMKGKGKVQADYKARPFMGPAGATIGPQLPEMWRNQFKK